MDRGSVTIRAAGLADLRRFSAAMGGGLRVLLRFGRVSAAILTIVSATLLVSAPVAKADLWADDAPTELNFGSVALNTTVTDNFSLSVDPGYTYSLALGAGGGLSAPFSLGGASCSASGICTFSESYMPTGVVSSSATLNLDECPNAGGNCVGAAIKLLGSGYSVFQNSAPVNVAFGPVALNTTKTQSFTVTADRGYTYSLALGAGGGLSAPFSLNSVNCNTTGTSCAVTESYEPASVSGSHATLNLDECPNAGGNCLGAAIKLSGSGSSVFENSAPSGISFGSVTVGATNSKSFTLSVDQGYSYGLALGAGGGLSAPFALGSVNCSASGASCGFEESFNPSSAGAKSATLNLVECPDAGGTCIGPAIALSGTGVPKAILTTTKVGTDLAYAYSLDNLSGVGDVLIPILDPSALVTSSLPKDAVLINNPGTLWAGSGNTIPANESLFDDPAALLEIPVDELTSLTFSFLDRNAPINGPIVAGGLLIDPQVPGVAPVPEPSTWVMLLVGFSGGGLVGWRKRRNESAATASFDMN